MFHTCRAASEAGYGLGSSDGSSRAHTDRRLDCLIGHVAGGACLVPWQVSFALHGGQLGGSWRWLGRGGDQKVLLALYM